MKKKMGLIQLEVSLFASILIRLFTGFLAYYYLGQIIEAVQIGEVVKRGRVYTIDDDTSAYYARLFLYSAYAIPSVWFATFGTKVKNGN